MVPLRSYIFMFVVTLYQQVHGQSLVEVFNNFVKDSAIAKANNSLLALDLVSGDTLFNFQSDLPLITASTTKIFSTALALEVLGAEFRFKTELYKEGIVKDSILKGNIWVRGLGDVSFGSRFFNQEGQETHDLEALIDALKEYGIKQVNGYIWIDGSAFGYAETPQGWSSWDAGNYYGAFPSGVNFYDNSVNYIFSTGRSGSKAKFLSTYPKQNALVLQNRIISARVQGDNTNLEGEAYHETRLATGKLPVNQANYKVRGSVANPERNFADALAQVCLEQGFVVSKGVLGIKNRTLKIPDYDAISKITSLPGRTVREIVQWTNGKSVNFFAEGLLNGVAYHLTGCGSSANSIKVYREYLALKMDTSNLRLYDGSGLSRLNRISANHLCDFLTYIFHSDIFHIFKSSLPVAGNSGTLKELCKGQPGENRVFAKSGTMTGIKSYAGYVESISGRKIVFALISSGYSCNQSYVKQQMELLMNALATL